MDNEKHIKLLETIKTNTRYTHSGCQFLEDIDKALHSLRSAEPLGEVDIDDYGRHYGLLPTDCDLPIGAPLFAASPLPSQAVPGWVKCSERLPEEGITVLVYTPLQDSDEECLEFDGIMDGVWVSHADHYEHFMAVGGPNAAGPDMVCTGPSEDAPYTHWMPLPEPPKGE